MKMKKILAIVLVALLTLTIFSGCEEKEVKEAGVTEISWYLAGVRTEEVHQPVWDKVNEILEERYGMRLNVVLTDGGNFAAKLQMMNAAQEAYDLVFTSNWRNDYATNVENRALLDLTNILPKYAPTLYASLSEAEKSAVTVDGRMYAVPNWQVQARAMGIAFPKEILEESGFTLDDFDEISDFGPYLEKVVAKHPEMNQGNSGWNAAMIGYGMVTVAQEGMPGVIRYTEKGKPTVINQYETEEFMEFVKMIRSWWEKGLIPKVRSSGTTASQAGIITNPGYWTNWKPGYLVETGKNKKYELVGKQLSPAVLSTEVLLSSLTGIGAYSKHPEEAVKMLEIMYTDKEVYNMLSFGIEGVNYEKVGENTIKTIEGNKYSIANWSIGSVANSYILAGNPEDIWEQTKEFNETAIVSPLLGFAAKTENILGEYGNVNTVIKEYFDRIQNGYEDPEESVPKFIEKLKVAGADRIVAELQRQVDEWWETKKDLK